MPRKILVESSFWIFLALLTLTLPLNWALSAILAATVHELGHLTALWLMSVPVPALHLRAGGAVLDTGSMSPGEELLCAVAGPAASFALLIPAQLCPRIAFCAFVQGIFNMIPLNSFDGARVLKSAFYLMHGKSPCKRGKMRVQ